MPTRDRTHPLRLGIRLLAVMLTLLLRIGALGSVPSEAATALPWPEVRRETRPWAYWWWMGSAVDKTNLTRELRRYHDAGLGGVHIIPIYGARGFEARFIDYLSPKWMEMLSYTVREAERFDLGVDMTMGSGWCFGGPHVTDAEANARVLVKTFEVSAGMKLPGKVSRSGTQALMAFSSEGRCLELTKKIEEDGTVNWSPTNGVWELYAVSQRPSGQKVKRAAPGGQGHMLNLIYPQAMAHYLSWFDEAFSHYHGLKPRALYHDSYEYRSDWAPDFFTVFERRRGYRLQTELPALFADSDPTTRSSNHASRVTVHASRFTDPDHIARVKSDYRETISEVMAEDSLPLWHEWAHRHGFITRNEAHGSPGNWLDLYAAADIPETEMFHLDRNKLVSKFASSAAHVTGGDLAAAETGTWLAEHFTETLAEMKYLVDDMFLSGINHVFYHGTCYSPDDAAWPGWVFYASCEMNPRNSIWHDVPALNAYVARCQTVLQAGRADNDILLYWPIHDLWHNPAGLVQPLTVHGTDWFEAQPIGKLAERLWSHGYAFDYISDRQLTTANVKDGRIVMEPASTATSYCVVVVPRTQHMPVGTFRKLLGLAKNGATIIFEQGLPADVPGWGKLEERQAELKELSAEVPPGGGTLGKGQVVVGEVEAELARAEVAREPMFEAGLMCVRRAFEGGHYYFVANRSDKKPVDSWVSLGRSAGAVSVMNPLTGSSSMAAIRHDHAGAQVRLQLAPGESLLLRCTNESNPGTEPPWRYWQPSGNPVELTGIWHCSFIQGGPELPATFQTRRLASWTELGDTNAQRFAGSAVYAIQFSAPKAAATRWQLDLGKVCQSARVRLNGQDFGTRLTPPFRVVVGPLKPTANVLEVEVTNTSANRIRDLDRRGVKWKNFYDINVVGLDYKPFDASHWPLAESGLIGPVTLTAVKEQGAK